MRKKRKFIGENHRASFEKYGFCVLPGCRCYDRKPATYHRIDKIVEFSKPLTDEEIKEARKKWARIQKIRNKRHALTY